MKHPIKALSLAVVLAIAALAYEPRSAEGAALGEQGLTDAQVATIKETIETWSQDLVDGDFEAWAAHWAEDAVLMPPGHDRVVGREQLVTYMKANYDAVATLTSTDWDFAGRDDLAVVTNNVTFTAKSGGGDGAPVHIKQIIVLRMHDDGAWLVQSVIFNMGAKG